MMPLRLTQADRKAALYVVYALLCLGGSAAAMDPGQLPEVEVHAGREALERQADRFVTELLAPQRPQESLSKWTTPVCPLVAGLSREAGETLLRALTTTWQSAGVPLAGARQR